MNLSVRILALASLMLTPGLLWDNSRRPQQNKRHPQIRALNSLHLKVCRQMLF